jgi:serralysin
MSRLDDLNRDLFEDDITSRVLGSYIPLANGQDGPATGGDGAVSSGDAEGVAAAAGETLDLAVADVLDSDVASTDDAGSSLLDEAPAAHETVQTDLDQSKGGATFDTGTDTNEGPANIAVSAEAMTSTVTVGLTVTMDPAAASNGNAAQTGLMAGQNPGFAGPATAQANTRDASFGNGTAGMMANPAYDRMMSNDDLGAPGPAATLLTLSTYLNERGTGSGGNDFWDEFWSPMNSPFFNLGSSGTNAKNGVIHYNLTSFPGTDSNGTNSARHEIIRHALNVYEDILGINFVETTSTDTNLVDLFFFDNVSGRAYANWDNVSSGGAVNYGYVQVASNWEGGIAGAVGDYVFQTYLHEIGHTLGLGHQGLYNAGAGSPTYNDAYWVNDTTQQTMMSYWGQGNYNGQSSVNLISPMAVDWLTLDRLYNPFGYGIDNGVTSGNTTWGFNSSWVNHNGANEPAFGYANTAYASFSTMLDTNAACIVDGGGIDTLDLSGFGNNTVIDMRVALASSTSGSISSVAGLIGNLTLAVGTIIENIIGGAGNERIHGNDVANNIRGGSGNDTIYGYSGTDSLYGEAGNDVIYAGGNPGDYVDGGSGNDWIEGGLNGQTLIGGAGNDSIFGDDFSPTSSVADSIDGGDGNDYVLGANAGDTIRGGSGDDNLRGGGGNDTIYGDSGNDTLRGEDGDDMLWPNTGLETGEIYDGGAGNDTLNFSNFFSNYVANLGTGVFSTGATTTTVTAVENVLAGVGDDTLIGDSSANLLDGGAGDDWLQGDGGIDTLLGGAGDDTIYPGTGGFNAGETFNGGAGTDLLEFSGYNNNYRVDLAAGEIDVVGGGFLSSLVNIENVNAGNGNDVITGDYGANALDGGGGNDVINGGGGADTLIGGDGNDTLEGGYVTDSIDGGDGDDLIRVLDGEYYDSVDGGIGNDTLDHSASTYSGEIFDFSTGVMTGSHYNGGSATVINVETYLDGSGDNTIHSDGSGFFGGGGGNDTIVAGNGTAETLDGGLGIDLLDLTYGGFTYVIDLATGVTNFSGESFINFENLISGVGNDSITGSSADNMLNGGAGDDTILGASGTDTIYGGDGNDDLNGGLFKDDLFGEAGDDTFRVTSGDFGDNVDGGSGSDTLNLSGWTNSSIAWMVDLAAGTYEFLPNSYGVNGEYTAISIENVIGSDFNDVINGSGDANMLNGGGGDDTLTGGGGTDTIYGGVGNDDLNGGSSKDDLFGEDGDDTFRVTGGDFGDNVDGGNGTDLLDLSGWTNGSIAWMVDLAAGTYELLPNGFGVNGEYMAVSIENVIGSAFDDVITGSDVANMLNGGDGHDSINGYHGADTLDGGIGRDTVDGGNGNDLIYGGFGNDLLFGGFGHDTLDGNGNNDTIDGGNGDDLVIGGLGNDVLTGGAGKDTLNGGKGNDTITSDGDGGTYLGGAGRDWMIAGIGDETMKGGGGGAADTIDLRGFSGDYVFNMTSGLTQFAGQLYAKFEVVLMGAGDDTVRGSFRDDTVLGGDGKDRLIGKAGDDSLVGGAHYDKLYGGTGSDTLNGGTGKDTMKGGGDDDVFIYMDGDQRDRISDMTDDVDEIWLDSALWGGGLTVLQMLNIHASISGNDVILTFDSGDVLTLDNFAPNGFLALENDIVLI